MLSQSLQNNYKIVPWIDMIFNLALSVIFQWFMNQVLVRLCSISDTINDKQKYNKQRNNQPKQTQLQAQKEMSNTILGNENCKNPERWIASLIFFVNERTWQVFVCLGSLLLIGVRVVFGVRIEILSKSQELFDKLSRTTFQKCS